MDKKNLAFTRTNFILLAIGMAVVLLGFILMSGAGSSETAFNPDIFSARRIKVAPAISFLGFVLMIVEILFPSNRKERNKADIATVAIT